MFKRIFVLMGTVSLGLAVLCGLLWLLIAPAQVIRAAPPPPGCQVIDRDFDVITTLAGTCYHFVTDTVNILPGIVVTVAPPAGGSTLYFSFNARVQVDGTFRALGQFDRPITFTSALANPARGAWHGIIFVDGSDPLDDVIQYSTIEYALAAIQSGDEDNILILSNTFRYNGGASSLAGAIMGDTDNSTIRNNVVYSNSNGIVLNESFGNQIISNVVHTIDHYGVRFAQSGTQGGWNNTIQENEIYWTGLAGDGGGLRLETGSDNQVLSNSVYLNSGAAIYLLDQTSAEVQHNYVYENNGSGYPAGIYVTGTAQMGAMSYNVISDTTAEAVEFDVGTGGILQASSNNALCSLPDMEWRNSGTPIGDAPGNWWSTNVPLLGVNYTGFTTVTSPIMLSFITTTSDLPADGISTSVITISFRDASGQTVPPASTRQTNPPAPNPRRVELATTMGVISPVVVYVGDDGFATATLTSAPTTGTAFISATAFCDYSISIPVRFAATNLAINKTALMTQTVVGGVVAYRISYSNTGGIAANEVRITDTLPPGSTWVNDTAAPLGWARIQTLPQVIYTRLSLLPGAQESFILTATVTSAACNRGPTNTVSIGTRTNEDTVTDNQSAAHTPISGCPVQIYLPIILRQDLIVPVAVEVAFGRSNYYVRESAGVATIMVVLNLSSTQTVTVNYATSDGTATAGLDYIASAATLTFAPGATSATFTVQVLADTVTETVETVNLTLSNPVNAVIGQPHPATLTIVDPCPPTPPNCAPAVWCIIPSDSNPTGVAYDSAAGRLFVANQGVPFGTGNLSIFDNSGLPVGRADGLSSPHDVAYDAARGLIYVVGWDSLFVVNGSTYAVTRTIPLGTNMGAFGMAYNPHNSKLYVSGFNNRTIVIVDMVTLNILKTIASSNAFPISDPTYIAVNPNNDKAYVVNHTGGPYGWLVVLDGATDEARQVVPAPDVDHGGDFYGIAVDSIHNRVYVTSISQAYLYMIDSATDIPSPWAVKIVRGSNPAGRQVPLRMVAVNPDVGGLTHVWLTSIATSEPVDFWGLDRLMLLPFDSWPPASPIPMATEVAPSPIYGLTLDPGTGRVFASNMDSDLVTASQDMTTLCSTPLSLRATGTDSEAWAVVVPAYGSSSEKHGSRLRAR